MVRNVGFWFSTKNILIKKSSAMFVMFRDIRIVNLVVGASEKMLKTIKFVKTSNQNDTFRRYRKRQGEKAS